MRSTSEKAAAVSALRNDVKEMELRASAKKNFETKQSSVFAAPGLPLAHFLTAEFGFSGDEFSPSWRREQRYHVDLFLASGFGLPQR
jgi:hypothetical protein